MDQSSPLEGAYAWARSHPQVVDGLLAGACVLALVVPFLIITASPAALLLGLGLTVPLGWRRNRPVLSASIVAAAGYLQLAAVGNMMLGDAAVLLSLYALAAYAPAWAGRAGLVTGLAGAAAAVVRYGFLSGGSSPAGVLAAFGAALTVVLAAWLLGHLRRLSLQNERRLAERARLLEVERDQETRLAATAERARIARELHDVVAHSLSVTVAQADGGRYAAAADPGAAVAALETISGTARQALGDMRALLGVLREDDGGSFLPQPGILAIPGLVSQVGGSGLDVGLTVTGQGQQMAQGPELAAYRIVQESLTNVLKHGGPACRAQVQLDWSAPGLTITVSDDGRGAAAVTALAGQPGAERGGPSSAGYREQRATDGQRGSDRPGGSDGQLGQGVLGMRERAALHGGHLDAGPRPGGGYAVRAFLPYRRSS